MKNTLMIESDEIYIYIFHQRRNTLFHTEELAKLDASREDMEYWQASLNEKKNHLVSYGYSHSISLIKHLHDFVGGKVELNIGQVGGDLLFMLQSLRESLNIEPFEFRLLSQIEFGIFMSSKGIFSPLDKHNQIRVN